MAKVAKRRKKEVFNGPLYVKRRHPRIDVKGFIGDVADGNFFFEGNVENISSDGFKLSNLPQNFSAVKKNYTMVLSGGDRHYRLIVVPCWKEAKPDNSSLDVGFKIVQASWEWSEFIFQKMSAESLHIRYAFQA